MRPVSHQHSRSTLSNHFHDSNNESEFQAQLSEGSELEAPTDIELVLLCLDYLRTLRRFGSTSSKDLEYELGLNKDYITLAIWALSKSFLQPSELLHGNLVDMENCLENPLAFGNDSCFQPGYAHFAGVEASAKRNTFQISNRISIPSLALMESEILYRENPKKSGESSSANDENSSDFGVSKALLSTDTTSFNPHRISWYEYEDEHYSNQFRFYKTAGLSSKGPLDLSQIVRSGLITLNAQSRGQAEENMMSDQLFTNFVDAVSKNGFFNITEKEILNQANGKLEMSEDEKIEASDKIHEERFRKVTTKFRTKLAAKYEDEVLEREPFETGESSQKDQMRARVKSFGPSLIKHQATDYMEQTGDVEKNAGEFQDFSKKRDIDEDVREKTPIEAVGDDDDATLVASSVYGDIMENEKKIPNDDESSRTSKSSRKVVVDKQDFETAERMKGYGNAAMQKKKYEKAKNYYTKALELLPAGPTSHVYFSNRAAALLSMRNFNEAVWDAERSLALKPDYSKAHARLGLAHFLLENYQEAVDSYTLAVQYDPSNKTSESYLEKSKKKLEANETVEKKVSAEPLEEDISGQNLSYLVRPRGAYDAEETINVHNRNRKSIEPSGTAIVRGDPPGESRMERSLSPKKSSLRNRLQRVKDASSQKSINKEEEYIAKDDPPDFHSAASGATSKFSDDQVEADHLKGLGNKAMARKEYEKAVRYYSKSLRLAPAGPNSHVYFSNRAAALCYLERYEEAELDAERSLALNPDYGKAHARLGLSRYFLKDYFGAVEAYESALIYDPQNAASKSYLAKAKAKIGKRKSSGRSRYVE